MDMQEEREGNTVAVGDIKIVRGDEGGEKWNENLN